MAEGGVNIDCTQDDVEKAYEYIEQRLSDPETARIVSEVLNRAQELLNIASEQQVMQEVVASILAQAALMVYKSVRLAGRSSEEALREAYRLVCIASRLAYRIIHDVVESGVLDSVNARETS